MVKILDATLREGEQTPGVYFPPHAKLAIAKQLDKVGINIIEAGHPLVSKNIYKAVKQIASAKLNAVVGAHSRSMKNDVDTALECGVSFLGIFYCVSKDRLKNVFNKDIDSAISQITKTIKYAKENKPSITIRYTPEDTVRSDFSNVIKASVAAVRAGASIISIADTTGYMIPGVKERSMYNYVLKLKQEMEKEKLNPKIAVHCHNDRGLAIANALDAYRAGADIIDVTALGLGERAGIVDMAQLLVLLAEDFKENKWNLKELPKLYQIVSRYSHIPIPINFPVTGENAFTHCAGVHTHAARVNPVHYQSIDPEAVGRKMDISLDHMSGRASVRYAFEKIGEAYDEELVDSVLEVVKERGEKGKVVHLDELHDIVVMCQSS